MEYYFVYGGIALCLFSLWAIGRHDWLRLSSLSRSVTARVTGHREHYDDGARNWAAIYRFSAEGSEHEVIDSVYGSTRSPPEGTEVRLTFPVGHPELARPPRPLMWLGVYGVLLFLLGMLTAKAMGWLH
ncbi:MAG: hypothetical protein KGL44_00815 [Sphingomonadales bacterium]|nr:hypothetical protein [Sphingomonadales bacterium]